MERRRLAKEVENYNPLLGIFKSLFLLGEHLKMFLLFHFFKIFFFISIDS